MCQRQLSELAAADLATDLATDSATGLAADPAIRGDHFTRAALADLRTWQLKLPSAPR